MEETKNMFIKLNHIYEGTPPITKKWLFDDYKTEYKCVIAPKKGEEIGDLNFSDKAIKTFMHEFRMMGLICMMPGIGDSLEWSPYISYISGQFGDFNCFEGEEHSGACRQFQKGISKVNFAIDTIGEYCQCNLIDSSVTVKDPMCTPMPECEECEYKNFDGCKTCGSEKKTICNFHKEYARSCQEFEQLRMLLDKLYENNSFNNQNSCNCHCDDQKDQPVYCVKNYSV